MLVHKTGHVGVPVWVGVAACWVAGEEPPPKRLSGATLAVQQRQREEEWEQMAAARYRQVIGRPRLVLRQQASEEQLALLVAMGFPQDQARHALQTAHGNLGSAIQLLTSAQ